MKKTLQIIGALVGLSSFVLAWYFYDWKLSVIIFLALLGNNIERSNRK